MNKEAPVNQTLELWQAEWCPSSHRVRQRLTELGLTFTAHQVPVRREARVELMKLTGYDTIPVLRTSGKSIASSDAILKYLNDHYAEPAGAADQRARAAEIEQQREEVAACAAR
jgi:glutathione S-transferase